MSFLLRLIPEPWASVAIVAAVALAYLYGNVTGTGTERQRQEAERLRQTVAVMRQQQAAALDIQTKMAQSMAALRVESQEREKLTDDIIEELRAAPSGGACTLSDARRMRLQSIRIGPPSNPRSR